MILARVGGVTGDRGEQLLRYRYLKQNYFVALYNVYLSFKPEPYAISIFYCFVFGTRSEYVFVILFAYKVRAEKGQNKRIGKEMEM
jgi:hypothetical protein